MSQGFKNEKPAACNGCSKYWCQKVPQGNDTDGKPVCFVQPRPQRDKKIATGVLGDTGRFS